MLKTCFECLVGTNNSREDMYDTRLNGQTTMWSTRENDDIFLLPRPLKNEDIMSVHGDITRRDKLYFRLITGMPSRDNQNIAVQMEVDFLNDIITLLTSDGEQTQTASQKPSSILNTENFSLNISVRDYNGEMLMDIKIEDNILETLQLDSSVLQNITFFTLSNSIYVKDLTFTFA